MTTRDLPEADLPATLEHPLRQALANEIHARPPVPVTAPEQVACLAFLRAPDAREIELAHLAALGERLGVPLQVSTEATHLVAEFPGFRLKWEFHSEFSSYTIFRRNGEAHAVDALPRDWLSGIRGQLIAAVRVDVRAVSPTADGHALLQDFAPWQDLLVASQVADGTAWVTTDLRLADGWSRFLLLDQGLGAQRAGRTVQRLLEIEIYRVMALLAFPEAKRIGSFLSRAEEELATLIDRTGSATCAEDERAVLADLTRLAAEAEHSVARSAFRFGAAAAYFQLVEQRVAELKEVNVPGQRTLRGVMERRLAPAMNTCQAIARRQNELSARIARNSQLLRTRVDIELERQNQQLLVQMNQRAKLQLRLQETVEGLSVVAITYYGSQLVHYLAKGAKQWLGGPSPELATAVAIPVIALVVAAGLRRMRRALAVEEAALHH